MVAFVENWLPCPSLDKIRGYDKVIVSFAVSYVWNPTKNQCDQSCNIGMPATCNNQAQPDLIEKWQQAGTKVRAVPPYHCPVLSRPTNGRGATHM